MLLAKPAGNATCLFLPSLAEVTRQVRLAEFGIDGFGMAMFLNHSCDPNCETEQDANHRIFIRTLRRVAAGEELTYEYNLYDSDEKAQNCCCAASNCRATMFSTLEIKRRTRIEKRKAASKL